MFTGLITDLGRGSELLVPLSLVTVTVTVTDITDFYRYYSYTLGPRVIRYTLNMSGG